MNAMPKLSVRGADRTARPATVSVREPRWGAPSQYPIQRIPRGIRCGLLRVNSLTAQLRALCPDGFRVALIRQSRTHVRVGERRFLGLPKGAPVLQRQVYLVCRDRPVVFAHSILPVASLRGHWAGLGRLGVRPLGEALFSDRSVRRGPLQVARLVSPMSLYAVLADGVAEPPAEVWGRRSIFHLPNGPVMVSEFFLSDYASLLGSGL